MNFGQNFYDWLLGNAQPLILAAIVIIAIYLAYKREFTKMIGFLVIATVVVVIVYNTAGVKDLLLELGNQILGTGGKGTGKKTSCSVTGTGMMHSVKTIFTRGAGIRGIF